MSGQKENCTSTGRAALHLHSSHSDGRHTVTDILSHLEATSDLDIVAVTDHDEISGFQEALEWKVARPGARIEPLWGCEITVQAFKHILAFIFEPPYPTRRFPSFRPLEETFARVQEAHGVIIIAHPDTFWVGVGLKRLGTLVDRYPVVVGIEAYNPYCRSAPNIEAFARHHNLAIFGGSDAHFMEHMLKYTVLYPGKTAADLKQAFFDRTTSVVAGPTSGKVPVREIIAQQFQALVTHPAHKLKRALQKP